MTDTKNISDDKAREILRRAAEIDRSAAEVMSIETLRAAAQEAGIAESSFEAALSEHTEGKALAERDVGRRRILTRVLAGAGAAMLLLIVVAMLMRLFVSRVPAP